MVGGAFVLAACAVTPAQGDAAPSGATTLEAAAATTTNAPVITTVEAGASGNTTTSHAESGSPVASDPVADDSDASDVAFVPLDLGVGTCFDDPSDDVDLVTPDDIPIVECEAPHDNEVVGSFEIGEGEYPGDADIQTRSEDLCHDAFEVYLGAAYESSAYDFSWYFPTEESWPIGGTKIICFAYNTDLSSITGSVDDAQR